MTFQSIETAVIPSAGLGTRLRPLTEFIPKEMLPVGLKPVIHHVVDEAVGVGVKKIVFVLNPQKQILRRYLNWLQGETSYAEFKFVIQKSPSGVIDALLLARRHLRSPFIVLFPDNLFRPPGFTPLARMLSLWERYRSPIIALEKITQKDRLSLYAEVRGEWFRKSKRLIRVLGIKEKPEEQEVVYDVATVGRHLLTPEVLEVFEEVRSQIKGEAHITFGLDAFAQRDRLLGYLVPAGRRIDVGNPEGYRKAFLYL